MDKMYKFACRLSNIERFQGRCMQARYSVADHSYRVALLTMRMCDEWRAPGLDSDLALRIALLHDLEESGLGDVPSPFKKYFTDYDNAAHNFLVNEVELPSVYLNTKAQYGNDTLEGKIVKLADAVECFITASYEIERGNVGLRACFDELQAGFETPSTRTFLTNFPYVEVLVAKAVADANK